MEKNHYLVLFTKVGEPQRCSCGHIRSKHQGLDDMKVDDTSDIRMTSSQTEVPWREV